MKTKISVMCLVIGSSIAATQSIAGNGSFLKGETVYVESGLYTAEHRIYKAKILDVDDRDSAVLVKYEDGYYLDQKVSIKNILSAKGCLNYEKEKYCLGEEVFARPDRPNYQRRPVRPFGVLEARVIAINKAENRVVIESNELETTIGVHAHEISMKKGCLNGLCVGDSFIGVTDQYIERYLEGEVISISRDGTVWFRNEKNNVRYDYIDHPFSKLRITKYAQAYPQKSKARGQLPENLR
jgi:hypothetical protein